MHTTRDWWAETKSDPEKLAHWLKRQYVGELAAVNLLSEVLLKFGADMTKKQWHDVYTVMQQEALHAHWVKGLLDSRGLSVDKDADPQRRYWMEVLPEVDDLQKAGAAAYDAEHMRLYRIREIAQDTEATQDIREVFAKILPHEEWHEEVFSELRGSARLDEARDRGLRALSLILS